MKTEQNTARPAAYSPERLLSAARDHAAYGWAHTHHWNADGTAWSDEQKKIYDDEFDRLTKSAKGGDWDGGGLVVGTVLNLIPPT